MVNQNSELLNSFIEVKLSEPDAFLKVKETLTRIGVASKKDNTLFQSCHILHKQGQFYIVHFKEMFKLDGKPTNFTEDDIARRNTIANLLAEWDLLNLVHTEKSKSPVCPMSQIKILAFKDKGNWSLVPKYTLGKKKND